MSLNLENTTIAKLTIEKGIPIPPKRSEGILPFDDLQVGDSFLHPKKDAGSVAMSAAKKRFPERQFISRVVGSARRIWRVK